MALLVVSMSLFVASRRFSSALVAFCRFSSFFCLPREPMIAYIIAFAFGGVWFLIDDGPL
jgi:hypothetical protein